MKTGVKVALSIGAIFLSIPFVPTRVLIEYYSNTGVSYPEIRSDAYVWLKTSAQFRYYLIGASYVSVANGNVSFNFNSTNENARYLSVDAITLRDGPDRYDVAWPRTKVFFRQGHHYSNGSPDQRADVDFMLPSDMWGRKDSFTIRVTGSLLTDDGEEFPFVFEKRIVKESKVFTTPLYRHWISRLTIT